MPGAYKLIIFFSLEHIYGLSLLGNIASWQSIAQVFGFFTAIGWCSLILVRIPKANSRQEKISNYNKLLGMGILTLIALSIPIYTIGAYFSNTHQALQILAWLLAWTLYQMPRHYFIAQRSYRAAFTIDATILTASLICLITISEQYISTALASCMLITGLLTSLAIQSGRTNTVFSMSYERKGLEYGLINLLSGGITLSLIPLAHYLSSSEFAGSISLFLAIISIALLIPRAISTYQLPELSKTINNATTLKLHSKSMQRVISLSNLATTAFNLICAAFISSQNSLTTSNYLLFFTLLLITLQNTIATQGLVYSNILMACEETKQTIRINTLSLALFVISCLATLYMENRHSFLTICTAVSLIYILRLTQTRKIAIKKYDGYSAV
jgi:hypothetical protein